MKRKFKKHEIYETPQIFYTKYSLLKIIGFIYISLMFAAAFIFSIILIFNNVSGSIYLFLVSLIILICFISDLVHANVFKKQYIEITDEHIRIKSLIRTKLIKWTDIYSVEFKPNKLNSYIGIIHDNDFWLRTPSFIEYIARTLEFFNIVIYFNKFDNLDERKLFNTICNRLPHNLFR